MKTSFIALLLFLPLCQVSAQQERKPPEQRKPDVQATPQTIPQQEVQRSDEDVVRITTNLVQVDAVVTENNGKTVTDLRPDEIEIREDGRPQKVTHFSYISADSPLPSESSKSATVDKNAPPLPPVRIRPEEVRRTIALVVDDLGLSFESTYYVRTALKR